MSKYLILTLPISSHFNFQNKYLKPFQFFLTQLERKSESIFKRATIEQYVFFGRKIFAQLTYYMYDNITQ